MEAAFSRNLRLVREYCIEAYGVRSRHASARLFPDLTGCRILSRRDLVHWGCTSILSRTQQPSKVGSDGDSSPQTH